MNVPTITQCLKSLNRGAPFQTRLSRPEISVALTEKTESSRRERVEDGVGEQKWRDRKPQKDASKGEGREGKGEEALAAAGIIL